MLFDTVRILGAARASVFHPSAPAFAFLAAWLLAGEVLALSDVALVAVVWFGLWLTHPPVGSQTGDAQLTPQLRRRGIFVGIATVAGFGFGNVLRGLAVRSWDEVFFGTALSTVAAILLQIAVTRDWPKILGQFRAATPAAIALYAACGIATSLGSIFVTLAMKNIQIGLEELSVRTLVGTVLVLSGIAVLLMR
jgi:drug/metabolite transporter (DMT)-like permease